MYTEWAAGSLGRAPCPIHRLTTAYRLTTLKPYPGKCKNVLHAPLNSLGAIRIFVHVKDIYICNRTENAR